MLPLISGHPEPGPGEAGLVAGPLGLPSGTTQLSGNEAWGGGGGGGGPAQEGPGPRGAACGPSYGVLRGQLQSGMLLKGHGQESGRCLVQEPAKFSRVGLDQGGGEGVLLLGLQNALQKNGTIVRPPPAPPAPLGAPRTPQGQECDVVLPAGLALTINEDRVSTFPSSVTVTPGSAHLS